MKYIKPYKIFESRYTLEEYLYAVSQEFSKYNISAVGVRELLDNYKVAIEDAISSDVDPYTFVKNIANDMQLSDNGGFMSHDTPPPQPTTIKYL
jgi:hypothetical protein